MSRDRVLELGRQLSSDDRRWLRQAAESCDDGPGLKRCLLALLERSRDSYLSDNLRPVLAGLTDDEVVWLCGDYERERRRGRRERLRRNGRKPEA